MSNSKVSVDDTRPAATATASSGGRGYIVVLNDADVLSGTGKFTNRHAGNQFFRQLCATVRPLNFRTLSHHAKRDVAQSIVTVIEAAPRRGRFLKARKEQRTTTTSNSIATAAASLGAESGLGGTAGGWMELTNEEKILRTLLVLRRPTANETASTSTTVKGTDGNNAGSTEKGHCGVDADGGYSDMDVLSGTGKLTNRHAGNIYFRQLCQSSKPPAYRALTKLAKRNLALSIISVIEQRPGRFLAQKAIGSTNNTSTTLEWVELTLDEKLTRTLLVLQRDTDQLPQHQTPSSTLLGESATLPPSSRQLGLVVVVHPHDVLSGSGQFTNQHAGNIFFRQLCADLRPANYPQLTATAKRNVALQIIAAVQGSGGNGHDSSYRRRNPPGRFLAQHNGRQLPEWVELDAAETMTKTLETLKYVERRRQKKRHKQQQQPGESGSGTVRHQTDPTISIDSGDSIKTETTGAIAKRVKCA